MIVLAQTALETPAAPEAVWAALADLPARPSWHPGLAWARLDGPLAVGTRGAWKPLRARPVTVEVTDLDPGRRLVLRGTHGPPVAHGHYEHEVHPAARGDGAVLTLRMSLSGPLARPIARFFGGALGVMGTADAARALAELAQAEKYTGLPRRSSSVG